MHRSSANSTFLLGLLLLNPSSHPPRSSGPFNKVVMLVTRTAAIVLLWVYVVLFRTFAGVFIDLDSVRCVVVVGGTCNLV